MTDLACYRVPKWPQSSAFRARASPVQRYHGAVVTLPARATGEKRRRAYGRPNRNLKNATKSRPDMYEITVTLELMP